MKSVAQNHQIRWLSDTFALFMERSGDLPFVCGYSPDFWRTLIKNLVLDLVKLILLLETNDFPFDHFVFSHVVYSDYSLCWAKESPVFLLFPTKQKSLEFIVIFQNAKCSFYLDRAVHSILDSFCAQDIFIEFLTLFQKTFGNIQPFVSPCFCTFFFIWTVGAVFTFIGGDFRFISAFAFLFLEKYRISGSIKRV